MGEHLDTPKYEDCDAQQRDVQRDESAVCEEFTSHPEPSAPAQAIALAALAELIVARAAALAYALHHPLLGANGVA